MAIIKVSADIATSPQDSGPLTFDVLPGLFKDRSGNLYAIGDLAGSRPAQRLRKWYRDNRPKGI